MIAKYLKHVGILILGFGVGVGLLSVISKRQDQQLSNQGGFQSIISSTNNASTLGVTTGGEPILFAEITIPYLRGRSYESNLGELRQVGENESYTSFVTNYNSDGIRINGLLTVPKGEPDSGGWPAVVFVHGYIPPKEYRTREHYVSYVDFLARRGLVVFKIDLRGHDQSQGEPGGAYYSGDYVIDTLNAYSALQTADFVNGSRVGLWGHSMAGNVVFRSFVAKTIPKVVIWSGAVYSYSDWDQYRIQDGSYQPPEGDSERARKRRELFETYGEFDLENEFWKAVSATNLFRWCRWRRADSSCS